MSQPTAEYQDRFIVLDREGIQVRCGFFSQQKSIIEIEDLANKRIMSYHACARRSEIKQGGAVLLTNGDRIMRMVGSFENHKALSMWERQQWNEALLRDKFEAPKHFV